jgi:hypothetical protein
MANYTPVAPSRLAGANLSTGVLTALTQLTGDTFPAGADMFLRVKCGTTTTTIAVMSTSANSGPAGTFLAPLVLTPQLIANDDRLYGPFPAATFADPSDGLVHVTYNATTGISVQAINCQAQ